MDADSWFIGGEEIDAVSNEDRDKILEDYPYVVEEEWYNFVDRIKYEVGGVAYVNCEYDEIEISLCDIENFSIGIKRIPIENQGKFSKLGSCELDGMTKDEVENYIKEFNDIQKSLPHNIALMTIRIGHNDVCRVLDLYFFKYVSGFIAEGLVKTLEVGNDAIKSATTEC